MAKVHRMHRHDWWVPGFKQRGWMEDVEGDRFVWARLTSVPMPLVQYVLPFVHSDDGGELLHVPCENLPLPSPARSNRSSESKIRESGIPANVDIEAWYAAYQKRETLLQEKAPKTGEQKHDHYRDVAIGLYRASGYSIGDSIEKAYSAQGDELIRYLSDDKRHTLNRTHENEEEGYEQEDEGLND